MLVCGDRPLLTARSVVARDGIEIADVACRHGRGRGADVEEAPGSAIVFVRRGCFVRAGRDGTFVLDPTLAYCMNGGDEQRYDHPHDAGDDCTAVFLAPGLVASLRGEPRLPSRPLPVTPRVDLEHRLLLRAAAGDDDHEVAERALELAAAALASANPRPVASGRPATARARTALADGAREVLTEDPERSLVEVAEAMAVSPHHLSRVFRAVTGSTLARHRMRLRTRAALERLGGGDEDLARVAADTGFADQSHLCRVVRRELGHTPSALRRLLRQPGAGTRPRAGSGSARRSAL
jgi:AraC-like DNA-binding protein